MAESDVQRQTVFVTLEPVTAHVLAARLTMLFGMALGPDQAAWPVVEMDAGPTAEPPDALLNPASGVIVTAHHPHIWADIGHERRSGVRVVYVRPELLAIRRALGDLWPDDTPERKAWDRKVALDCRLQGLHVLSVERVHAGEPGLWDGLADCLDMSFEITAPTEPATSADAETYGEALAALLRASTADPAGAAYEPPPAPRAFPIRDGGEGVRFLGSGWCYPEETHAWTGERSATLLFPHDGGGPGLTCRLRGALAKHPDRGVNILVRSGAELATVTGAPDQHGEVDLRLTLGPVARAGVHVVEIRVDLPVRPCDVYADQPDARTLGFALREVELQSPQGRDADDAALAFLNDPLAHDVFSHARCGLALVCAADRENGSRIAQAIREFGAAETAIAGPWTGAQRQDGLEAVARGLAVQHGWPDLVVLCDGEAVAGWSSLVGAPGNTVLEGASVLVATGEPGACGAAFFSYAQSWKARVETSAHTVAALTWVEA